MWSGGHWASVQGLTDGTHDSAEQTGTGDILEAGGTLLLLSALLSLLLVISVIFPSPPWQSSALGPASTPTAAHLWTSSLPPSQWLALSSRDTTSCQWNDEKLLFIFIHRRKMNNFFLLIPLYCSTSQQCQVGVLVSQHYMMNNKKLLFTVGLEEIHQKRSEKGHSDQPLVPSFDFIHHFTTRRP